MTYKNYGYSDHQTWAPCYGHPNDPRTDDYFQYEKEPDESDFLPLFGDELNDND